MAYFRIEKSGLNTGIALETNPGTVETLTSANFIGDYEASLIAPKVETAKIGIGGNVGTGKMVTTKNYGELNSFKIPVANSNCDAVFRAGGAFVAGSSYQFGGSYSGMTSPNKGRISTSAVTITQYDGKEKYTLFGAKTATLKFGAKSGEVISLEASFQGLFQKANSEIQNFQRATPNYTFNTNGVLNLGGTEFDYEEIEVDIKPTIKMIESGSTSAGYLQAEITDMDPTITINVYPGDPATKDLWNMMVTNTPVPFTWTFGAGTGNTYTISAPSVQFESQEAPYNAGIQTRKIVLKPVYNSSYSYRLQVTVA